MITLVVVCLTTVVANCRLESRAILKAKEIFVIFHCKQIQQKILSVNDLISWDILY